MTTSRPHTGDTAAFAQAAPGNQNLAAGMTEFLGNQEFPFSLHSSRTDWSMRCFISSAGSGRPGFDPGL
jgi:hypothetical protein